MNRQVLKTEQKALEINLNDGIYGTFAEIGAGQEVARNFFQVGAAAGTIAKTMSAYDKNYSDAIYGGTNAGRYVSEQRLNKMLDHEYGLMLERIQSAYTSSCFFVFADTVQAINYKRTVKGNGWMGLRFQTTPDGPPNNLILHVNMLDKNNRQQQDAIGGLGVNLIYAAFYYRDNLEEMVISLLDGLKSRLTIDMIRLTGPDFEKVDNRLLALYLVKNRLCNVTMFKNNSLGIHASEFLYKKNLMVVRGNFRPPTLVTEDVFDSSFEQYINQKNIHQNETELVAEITIDNLTRNGLLEESDFIDRANMLCAMGYNVIISDCTNHQVLIDYLSTYKIKNLALVIGVKELIQIFRNKYEENYNGRLLVAFGELFTQNITVYVYPALQKEKNELLTYENMPIPQEIQFLYQHLLQQKQIVGVEKYDKDLLHIVPHEVYESISSGKNNEWEKFLPISVVNTIKEKGSFGYSSNQNQEKEKNIDINDASYF